MKSYFSLFGVRAFGVILLMLVTLGAFAQSVPQGINYQAIARDGAGNVIAGQSIAVHLTIRANNNFGAIVYSENHVVNTNQFGLFNLILGNGVIDGSVGLVNNFSEINWAADDHYLQVEVDFGQGLVNLGSSQLLTVPYAMVADTALNMPKLSLNDLSDVNTTGLISGQIIKWNGSNWVPANDEGFSGAVAGGDLAGSYPNPTVVSIQGVEVNTSNVSVGQALLFNGLQFAPGNVDTNPNDDLTLTSPLNGDVNGTISNNSLSEIQGNPISAGTPLAGDVLTWTGTQWVPGKPTGDISGAFGNITVTGLQGFDLSANAPANGQALVWDAVNSKWVPQTVDNNPADDVTLSSNLNGDVTGTLATTSVNRIKGVPVDFSGGISLNQVLGFDGTNWRPASVDINPTDDVLETDQPNALGDVSGSYTSGLTVNGIKGRPVSGGAPATGDVLKYNNTTGIWEYAPDIGTTFSAGSGIDITGSNVIVNTGDLNPNDDLLTTDLSGGDVSGTFSALSVEAIQGFPVSTSAPNATQNVLIWNPVTGSWTPQGGVDTNESNDITTGTTAGGDLVGTFPNPEIGSSVINSLNIENGSISTQDLAEPGSSNQVLITDGGGTIEWIDQTDLSITINGPAGGDLTGMYPNPQILSGAVTSSEILDNSVKPIDIESPGFVATVLTSNPSTGQVQWENRDNFLTVELQNATFWIGNSVDIATPRTITGDLTISNLGVATIANDVITTDNLAPNSVTSTDIADGAVGTSEINDGSILGVDISTDAVTAVHLAPNSVGTSEISTDAVTGTEILDETITTLDIQNNTIQTQDIQSPGLVGMVLTTDPVTGAVQWEPRGNFSTNELDNGMIYIGDASNYATQQTLSGDITMTSTGVVGINPNAVASIEILNGSIQSADLANGAVTTLQIQDATIDATDIATGGVNSTSIADGSILAADIATGGVTSTGILDGTIQSVDIANNAITTSQIQNGTIVSNDMAVGAVTTTQLLDGTIIGNDLSTGAVSSTQILNGSIQTIDIQSPGVNNQVLVTDASANVSWINQSALNFTPSGTAGGDLVGTYPNPNIAINAVASPEILDGSIGTVDIATNAVTSTQINDGTIKPIDINSPGLNDQVLVTDNLANVKWIDQTLIQATPSGVAGGSLSGTYPNPSIAANAITTTEIVDNSITQNDLSTGAVTSNAILDGTISSSDISNNAVTSSHILDGTIASDDLSDGSVGTDAILDASIQNIDMGPNSVTSSNILDGDIQANDLGTAVVTPQKIQPGPLNSYLTTTGSGVVQWSTASGLLSDDLANGAIWLGDGSGTAVEQTVSGDITMTNTGVVTISNDAIGSNEIINGSITSSDLAAGAISVANLQPSLAGDGLSLDATSLNVNTDNLTLEINPSDELQVKPLGIGTTHIATSAITSDKIKDGEVNTADLENGAVTTIKIQDDAVTSVKIQDFNVQEVDLANNSVTSAKIVDQTIATNDIAPGPANYVLQSNGVVVNWVDKSILTDDDWEVNSGTLSPSVTAGINLVDIDAITDITGNNIGAPALSVSNSLGGGGIHVTQGGLEVQANGAVISQSSASLAGLTLNNNATSGNILELNGGSGLLRKFTVGVDGGSEITTSAISSGSALSVTQNDPSQPIFTLLNGVTPIHSVTGSQATYNQNLNVNAELETDNFQLNNGAGNVGDVMLSVNTFGDASWGKLDVASSIIPSPNPGWILHTNATATGVEWVDPLIGLDNDWVETAGIMSPGSPTTFRVSIPIDDVAPVFQIKNALGTAMDIKDGGASIANFVGDIVEFKGGATTRMTMANSGQTELNVNDNKGLVVNQTMVGAKIGEFIDNTSGTPVSRWDVEQDGTTTIQPEGGAGSLGLHVNQVTNGGEIFRAEFNGTAQRRFVIQSEGNTTLDASTAVNSGLKVTQHSTGDLFEVGTAGGGTELKVLNDGTTTLHGDFKPAVAGAFDLGSTTERWDVLYLSGGVRTTSDQRLKRNIEELDYGLEQVLALEPVSYEMKSDKNQKTQLGLIAQDVQKIIQEIVEVGEDKNHTLSISYTELIPVLINAIQEQQHIIENQTTKIEGLSARLDERSPDSRELQLIKADYRNLSDRLVKIEALLTKQLVLKSTSK